MQERYPISEDFDAMQAFFDKFGTVAHIERRIPMYNHVKVSAKFTSCFIRHMKSNKHRLIDRFAGKPGHFREFDNRRGKVQELTISRNCLGQIVVGENVYHHL